MIDMILDDASYVVTLNLAALRAHAIFLHQGIIGAIWKGAEARRAQQALNRVEGEIRTRPLEVAA